MFGAIQGIGIPGFEGVSFMRSYTVLAAIFGGLAMASAGHAADKVEKSQPAAKPTALVRVSSLDELIANARYLAAMAGRQELGKQVESMLKERTGEKGLEGVDTKKPIGLVGTLKTKLVQSQAVLMLPIADEKAFLTMLDNVDLSPKKDKTGLYTLSAAEIPYPVLFRFANGYLYGTLKIGKFGEAGLAIDKLPAPAVLKGKAEDVLAAAIHLDQVPDPIKELILSGADQALAAIKDKERKRETEAAKKLRETMVDETALKLKALIEGGEAFSVRLSMDRKNHDLGLSINLSAKPGSELAKELAGMQIAQGISATLSGKESAFNPRISLNLPANIRKALDPVIDEQIKKLLASKKDENERALLTILTDALKPTAKGGMVDVGFDLRGPAKSGHYTLLVGGQVKEGEGIEKAMKNVLGKLPEAVQEYVKTDFAKVGEVNVHQLNLDKDKLDAKWKAVFGAGPIYFAVRKDAVFLGAGSQGLDAVKDALAAKPKSSNSFQAELNLSRLPSILPKVAKQLEADPKAVAEAAKKSFKTKDSDKVVLRVDTAKGLQLRLSLKTQVITFISLLANNEGDEDQ
jgi:hypothetical protein